ncbi:hypothetical protein Pla144_45810 [Bythopirellula polymerisocia]|uniref:Uncharacterized protein n=1 Tax=Bythopirellula polymerisocia TaxID=2528003 RepID=A0A5C6CD42_9BACT|nr:hypothetical protein Pla144_45810 [Bythopirellula polymerisocia]
MNRKSTILLVSDSIKSLPHQCDSTTGLGSFKKAGLDWTRVVPESAGSHRTRLALELLVDDSYSTQESRAQSFKAQGGGCRATYFNYAKRLKTLVSKA